MRVFVAQTKDAHCDYFISALQKAGYLVSPIPKDGKILLQEIKKHHPDLVFMEGCMPSLDAIGVLTALNQLSIPKPIIIVAAHFDSPHFIQQIINHGADYFLLHPFDISAAIFAMQDLIQSKKRMNTMNQSKFEAEQLVISYLNDFRVSQKLSGYNCLRQAILLSVEKPEYCRAITKLLYPEIGKTMKKKSVNIERSLRYAIQSIWMNGNKKMIRKHFNEDKCATNKEFIVISSQVISAKLNPGKFL